MIDVAWLQQILNKIGKNDDAAAMNTTLFAGQQDIYNEIAGLSMLSTDEKAMLAAERFGQIPIFEDWGGLVDINQFTAPGIDDLTLCQSRHPWATGWILKEDGGANSLIVSFGDDRSLFGLKTGNVTGEVAQLCSLREYRIGATGFEYFAPSDERLIFEVLVRPEATNDPAMDWFVGFSHGNGATFLTTPELVSQTTRRYGFAIDGDTNIYGISADGTTGEVTSDHDLVSLHDRSVYLKAIYDIGTDIKFYVDSTLIGTLSTNLPTTAEETGFMFFLYSQTTENDDRYSMFFPIRCRWQNGATP